MSGRIIEITSPDRYLHLERGFLAIRTDGETIGRVPLDDIDMVLAAAPGLYWSGNVLAALAERSVPVVLIGQNFAPIAHILPLARHHAQGFHMQAQADCPLPLRKRLWAQIVRAKIEAQAEILALTDQPVERLRKLKAQVKTGDSTNREALAAQIYWPLLMGSGFQRDRNVEGANALLNYGYTILRAAAARAIVGAGLNPLLSLHHASSGDALRLADDLMEPFRPAVDIAVFDLRKAGRVKLEPDVKSELASILKVDYITTNGHTPLSHVLVRLAQTLARVFLKEERALQLPVPMRPQLGQLPFGAP